MQKQTATSPSLSGRMLIASLLADESQYRRSAVLLVEHHDQGAMGILLDKDLQTTLDQMRQQVPRLPSNDQFGPGHVATIPVRITTWSAGQLDRELLEGLWFHAPADPSQWFHEGIPAWPELVREVGRSVYREALGIKGFPRNPWLN